MVGAQTVVNFSIPQLFACFGKLSGVLFKNANACLGGKIAGFMGGMVISHFISKWIQEKFDEKDWSEQFQEKQGYEIYRQHLKLLDLDEKMKENEILSKRRLMLKDTHPDRFRDETSKRRQQQIFVGVAASFEVVISYRKAKGKWKKDYDHIHLMED